MITITQKSINSEMKRELAMRKRVYKIASIDTRKKKITFVKRDEESQYLNLQFGAKILAVLTPLEFDKLCQRIEEREFQESAQMTLKI